MADNATIDQIEVEGTVYDLEDRKSRESLNGLSFSVTSDGILEVTYGEGN